MTIPMIGILVVGCIVLLVILLCVILEFLQERKDKTYSESPEGCWDSIENDLEDKSKPPSI